MIDNDIKIKDEITNSIIKEKLKLSLLNLSVSLLRFY